MTDTDAMVERLATILKTETECDHSFMAMARAAYLHVLREVAGEMCSGCKSGREFADSMFGVYHRMSGQRIRRCDAGQVIIGLVHQLESEADDGD